MNEKANFARIESAIRTSLQNGRRLLDDAEFLEFSEPPTTAYFLSIIAQEEFAKAFLLALVRREVIPWIWKRYLLRAAQDHACKQLLFVVMEYLNPDFQEFKDRCDAVVLRHELPIFPAKVADAIFILRHEKIGQWESQGWCWAEEPEYDREALAIANGKQDRVKQNALYVRLAADGGVASAPSDVTRDTVRNEMERAKRFAQLVDSLLADGAHPGLDYDKVEEAFKSLFASVQDSPA